jgi:DNA polymerase III delta prime subunit
MQLEERITQFKKKNYDRFYWWRRFKTRETLHPYTILQTRIEHGDFEPSDFHWMLLWERKLEKEALAKEKSVDKQHELRGIYGERKRRLMLDFEKDEAKIKGEMYKAFRIEFRLNEVELENEMLQFEGSLSEFYYYLSNKQKQRVYDIINKAK